MAVPDPDYWQQALGEDYTACVNAVAIVPTGGRDDVLNQAKAVCRIYICDRATAAHPDPQVGQLYDVSVNYYNKGKSKAKNPYHLKVFELWRQKGDLDQVRGAYRKMGDALGFLYSPLHTAHNQNPTMDSLWGLMSSWGKNNVDDPARGYELMAKDFRRHADIMRDNDRRNEEVQEAAKQNKTVAAYKKALKIKADKDAADMLRIRVKVELSKLVRRDKYGAFKVDELMLDLGCDWVKAVFGRVPVL